MPIKLLLLFSIAIHTIATIYSLRLIRETKYNIIWVLFIVGFTVLSIERYMQMINLNGGEVSLATFIWTGFIASVGLSLGIFYGHKLVKHIDHLNRQQQLLSRRILASTLHAEESSRSKISRELHDGLGPLLSAAKMSLSAIDEGEVDPANRKLLRNTTSLIDEAVRSLREISNNLSPRLLSDFGLTRALRNFVSKCGASSRMKITLKSSLGSQRFDKDAEVVIYRVVCELINNSIKHSSATLVTINITRTATVLRIKYSDNGCGFDPESVKNSGQGMSNITSRISALAGEITINSSHNKGMNAEISLPI